MKFRDCFKLIKEDSRRLGKNPYLIFFTWFTSYSSMITFWLRIGSWLQTKKILWRNLIAISVKSSIDFVN